MECHTGTHLDAPGHFNQAHFAAGLDVDTLDLEVLNGELHCFLRPKPSFLILVFANLRSKPNLWMISVLVAGQVLRYWSMFRDTLI
jgi:kynurenine formamidase